ncbi:MAG: FAD-dependent oxidoreductase [Leptospiraceae bacterium]|nr:FAD-dependent oxidoreductase [Leptospiraceae bacterium]MBK7058776.1 FAD-dependent oxidoreductase [Leptospiraceae bacterium]MBK9498381.1 FAD-dependent oxidoreductase [Leptospiraceae bacterium]MBP9164939.1 FAD-dependent oxidoreductase [Leptospiraceae bacterium]
MNRKILIIGGVAGGATAAARARRSDELAEITILERGGYISFANCGLPYYISGEIKSRSNLILQTPDSFYSRYRILVRLGTEAIQINRQEKFVLVKSANGEEKVFYDKLILSQGANPILPSIPNISNENAFTLRDIDDMDRIHNFIDANSPKNAVVVGAGFIGLEMAEALVERGLKVSLVEKYEHVMPIADPEFAESIKRTLVEKGINVITSDSAVGYEPATKNLILETGAKVPAEMILFSIGVRPELELAKQSGLEIGKTGGVVVNEFMESSDPSILVVGDMAEITNRITGDKTRIPLAGPANRQGRVAGANACGERKKYSGSIGSSVVKIFNKVYAMTGLTEKQTQNISASSVTVHPNHHAGYYPGSKQLSLKLTYSNETGKVLGAQAFGEEGVEKRVDVIATAILGGLHIEDLEELDLCYAPPFSSANDPVNMAAFVSSNDRQGFSPTVTVKEFLNSYAKDKSLYVLDVRNPNEFSAGKFPTAVNIPLPDLRKRLSEVPKDKEIFVHCQVGFRGHLAARILLQSGFSKVYNISGGFKSIELLFKG